jgi:redox-sensitive bicupin YhaK (pirin superfamily)
MNWMAAILLASAKLQPGGEEVRKSGERGYFDHGWLETYHTFSFGGYHDPKFMGFRNLRVINEDRIAAGRGFDTHGHSNMEILTLVLKGQLAHKDSMGNESIIRAGEVQVMSAGKGVTHSEYNPSKEEDVHLLQIWIEPDEKGAVPRYGQAPLASNVNEWQLIVSKTGKESSLPIRQDAEVYYAFLQKGKSIESPSSRYGWVQVIEGALEMNQSALEAGDGAAVNPGTKAQFTAKADSKLLFFNLK